MTDCFAIKTLTLGLFIKIGICVVVTEERDVNQRASTVYFWFIVDHFPLERLRIYSSIS